MHALLPLALAGLGIAANAASDVAVEARYEPPARRGGLGSVVATLSPKSPDLRVNAAPAPRLRLETPSVLLDRQAAAAAAAPVADPEFTRYLDLAEPLRFTVEPDPKVAPGTYVVPATLTFAYCSKALGWCKKGSERVELSVRIP